MLMQVEPHTRRASVPIVELFKIECVSRGQMKDFLMRSDTPNWGVIMMIGACYLHVLAGEALERLRRRDYKRLTGKEHP